MEQANRRGRMEEMRTNGRELAIATIASHFNLVNCTSQSVRRTGQILGIARQLEKIQRSAEIVQNHREYQRIPKNHTDL